TDYDVDLGLSITNMGPKVSYIDFEQADPLPTNFKFGFAYYLFYDDYNSLVLTGDMNKLLVKKGEDLDGDGEITTSDEWNETDPIYQAIFTSWMDDDGFKDIIWGLGAEYWYNKMIGLRMGFWNDDMGEISASTYGCSLRYDSYIFDFSYLDAGEGHPLTDTMRFSLNIGF
ncbi:MAG: PorV/PorQ family protein, partial [Candidatus Delongbacteria bacterium]|nr:PorV/PorQ family protein [Candidatus Delongbacteria bacterium]